MWRNKRLTSFRSNKYNARSTQCALHSHRSGLEAKVCGEIQLRKRAGDIADFRCEVDIPLMVNGRKVATYRADFMLYDEKGIETEVVEAKGMVLPLFRLKWAILEATRPDLKLTMVTR